MPRLSLLASAKKDIADQRQALASRAKRLKASQPKLLAFQAALRSAIDKSFAVSAAAGYCGNSSITIGIYCCGLESFKDQRLMKLLERIESLSPSKSSSVDYADYLNRDFRFEFDDVLVLVNAYVKSDSGLCRKVLKGVESRVVEQKIYEMVCE